MQIRLCFSRKNKTLGAIFRQHATLALLQANHDLQQALQHTSAPVAESLPETALAMDAEEVRLSGPRILPCGGLREHVCWRTTCSPAVSRGHAEWMMHGPARHSAVASAGPCWQSSCTGVLLLCATVPGVQSSSSLVDQV